MFIDYTPVKKVCQFCKKKFIPFKKNDACCSSQCGELYRSMKRSGYDYYRFKIFERDNFCCIYCGLSSIDDNVKIHVDHIYPRSKGGENDIYNLVTCCLTCNNNKSQIVLRKETILRLWRRNITLDKKSGLIETYEDLKEEFSKYVKIAVLSTK